MSSPSASNSSATPATGPETVGPPLSIPPAHTDAPPVIAPAPGWLFFIETLPLVSDTTDAAKEDTVQLSLESHSPLPLEQLAYGWRTDTTRQTLLYYATARERLRQAIDNAYERAGFLLPDFLLAPQKTPDVWHWLATPGALTAVRFANTGDTLPAEIRSWPLDPGPSYTHATRANAERALREPSCPGTHAPQTLFWAGSTQGKGAQTLLAHWRAGATTSTATLPTDAAWNADVRERPWLARTRKNRDNIRRINKVLLATAATWVLLAAAATAVQIYKAGIQAEENRLEARQAEADALKAKAELVAQLDELEAGKMSFFDALATLNHSRPASILFEKASTDTKSKRQIQINGTASNTTQVNDYADALRKNKAFTKVETSRVNTGSGRSTFDLRVTVGTLDVAHAHAPTVEEITAMLEDVQPTSTPTPPQLAQP